MKDYPDRMTAEQAMSFGEDVLSIVAQIPRGMVTTYGHILDLLPTVSWMQSYENIKISATVKAWNKEKHPVSLLKQGASRKKWRPPTLPHCIAVPSAQAGLTSLFGMGRGGTPPQ